MTLIRLETRIAAPPERCFDLSLSVDLHLASVPATGERVVSGPAAGLLRPGDEITWEGRHLARRYQLTVRITTFRDEMVSGPFRRMSHDHRFEPDDGGTLVLDEFQFASGVPLADTLVLKPYLRRFLSRRNAAIRRIAEGTEWRRYLEQN